MAGPGQLGRFEFIPLVLVLIPTAGTRYEGAAARTRGGGRYWQARLRFRTSPCNWAAWPSAYREQLDPLAVRPGQRDVNPVRAAVTLAEGWAEPHGPRVLRLYPGVGSATCVLTPRM